MLVSIGIWTRLAAHVFGSSKIFADDTPIPALDPGHGRTGLWIYALDDRSWPGRDPPSTSTVKIARRSAQLLTSEDFAMFYKSFPVQMTA